VVGIAERNRHAFALYIDFQWDDLGFFGSAGRAIFQYLGSPQEELKMAERGF
jgi:hypothetical protein